MKLKEATIKDFAEALGDDTIDDVEITINQEEHLKEQPLKTSFKRNYSIKEPCRQDCLYIISYH